MRALAVLVALLALPFAAASPQIAAFAACDASPILSTCAAEGSAAGNAFDLHARVGPAASGEVAGAIATIRDHLPVAPGVRRVDVDAVFDLLDARLEELSLTTTYRGMAWVDVRIFEPGCAACLGRHEHIVLLGEPTTPEWLPQAQDRSGESLALRATLERPVGQPAGTVHVTFEFTASARSVGPQPAGVAVVDLAAELRSLNATFA